jgi:hypothetical protein
MLVLLESATQLLQLCGACSLPLTMSL